MQQIATLIRKETLLLAKYFRNAKIGCKEQRPKAGSKNDFVSGLALHNTCSFESRISLKADTDLSLLFKLYLCSLKIFQGRVPKSVLARHYTDFSPEKLKEIYGETVPNVLR
jgi:hypothetical protein